MSYKMLTSLLLVVALVAGACGSAEDEAGSSAATAEAEATDESVGDGVAADDASDGNAGGDTADGGAGQPVDGVGCALLEGGTLFEVELAHGGDSRTDYKGDVRFYADDAEVHSTFVAVEFVRPGEEVKQEFFIAAPPEVEIDRCSADDVVAVEPFVLSAEVTAEADISACQNLRESDDGGFAYELTVSNPSTVTPVSYAIRVGLINPDGVRRATRLVLSDNTNGLYEEIAPETSVTEADQTLVLRYAEGFTCEVVAAYKLTTREFFDSTDAQGDEVGSLSADLGFATGSAQLIDEAFLVLGPVIDRITGADPVCVEGYADSVGSDEENLQLSQARAEAVADYLRAATFADITPIGRGEMEAEVDEVDDPALRRVDITLAACPAS